MEPVDATHIIQNSLKMFDKTINTRNMKVAANFKADNHYVLADPTRLQQVFWNLIGNALKFTPDRGSLIITTSRTANNRLTIEFADSGIGMEPEKISKIFNAF